MVRRRSKRKSTVMESLTKDHGGLRRSKRKLSEQMIDFRIYGEDFGILPSDWSHVGKSSDMKEKVDQQCVVMRRWGVVSLIFMDSFVPVDTLTAASSIPGRYVLFLVVRPNSLLCRDQCYYCIMITKRVDSLPEKGLLRL